MNTNEGVESETERLRGTGDVNVSEDPGALTWEVDLPAEPLRLTPLRLVAAAASPVHALFA